VDSSREVIRYLKRERASISGVLKGRHVDDRINVAVRAGGEHEHKDWRLRGQGCRRVARENCLYAFARIDVSYADESANEGERKAGGGLGTLGWWVKVIS